MQTFELVMIALIGTISFVGLSAALYAALVSGILRSLAARQLPPDELLAELNNQLQVRKLDSQYVTMLIAVWNDETRTLQVANAGSVQPIHVTFASSTATVVPPASACTDRAQKQHAIIITITPRHLMERTACSAGRNAPYRR